MMKCVICKHGETESGHVNVTLEHEGSVIIFKEVPAEVCDNCGEYYLNSEVTGDLLERAKKAAASGTEVQIQRFAA